jgi:hypothetical protein
MSIASWTNAAPRLAAIGAQAQGSVNVVGGPSVDSPIYKAFTEATGIAVDRIEARPDEAARADIERRRQDRRAVHRQYQRIVGSAAEGPVPASGLGVLEEPPPPTRRNIARWPG